MVIGLRMTAEWSYLVEKSPRPRCPKKVRRSNSAPQACKIQRQQKHAGCQTQDCAQDRRRSSGRSTVRSEFYRLCAAARNRLPLFRRPEILPSRRAVSRHRLDHRRRRQELSEIAGKLSKSFSPDKIEQALKGLMERHYIVPASSPAAVDGYRASLGLPPGFAGRTSKTAACGSRQSTSRVGLNSVPR